MKILVFFLMSQLFAQYCPPDRYIRDEGHGGRLNFTRTSQRHFSGSIESRLYDVYERCQIVYRSRRVCRGRGDRRRCRTRQVPTRYYSTYRVLNRSKTTPININFSSKPVLVPQEKEQLSVSYNAFTDDSPKIFLPNYYNVYTSEGYFSGNSYQFDIEHLERKRVQPLMSLKNVRISKQDDQYKVSFRDLAHNFLQENDGQSTISITLTLKRRKFVAYSVLVAQKTFTFDLGNISSQWDVFLGDFVSSSRKHKLSITLNRENSQFYNESNSPVLELKFFQNSL